MKAAPGWIRRNATLAATIAVFGLLFLTASCLYRGFFSWRVLTSLLTDNAFLGIAAIGMTLVIFSGGIDLSVGAVAGFSGILVATLIQAHQVHPLLAWALAIAAGGCLGAGMGLLIASLRLPAFLITLGGMFLARGGGFWINTDSVGINHPFYDRMSRLELDLGPRFHLPATALIFLLVAAAAFVLAHHTRFGRTLLAVGGNEQSALLMGLPVGAAKVAVYTLNGMCAAGAGVVATLYTGKALGDYGTGIQSAVLNDTTQTVSAFKTTGWMAGYTHNWTDAVRSNLDLSGVSFSSDPLLPATAIKSMQSGSVNTIVKLTKSVELGMEYIYESAKTFGSQSAVDTDGHATDKNTGSKVEVSLTASF